MIKFSQAYFLFWFSAHYTMIPPCDSEPHYDLEGLQGRSSPHFSTLMK